MTSEDDKKIGGDLKRTSEHWEGFRKQNLP